MENKLCSKCKLCKPISEYSKSKRGANGLRSNCKACDRVRCKEWKDKNPNKVQATNQKRDQQRKAEPEKEMLRRAKKRAIIRNIEFSIGVEDILIPYECPVLNKKLQYSNSQSVHRFAPSLDRKDITKGYVSGNVQVISYKANTMKSDATLEELQLFALWVLENTELSQGTIKKIKELNAKIH